MAQSVEGHLQTSGDRLTNSLLLLPELYGQDQEANDQRYTSYSKKAAMERASAFNIMGCMNKF
ncbi:MAG: hypothetical protein IPG08_17655 [Sphingobacteriaceae bacterium]|nr:hypothetical protein [Sphingobacteriaceae bacterium]